MGYFWNLDDGSILSAWPKDLFTEIHTWIIDWRGVYFYIEIKEKTNLCFFSSPDCPLVELLKRLEEVEVVVVVAEKRRANKKLNEVKPDTTEPLIFSSKYSTTSLGELKGKN